MPPRPLCLYHKNCLDGSGAAAVVRRAVPTCELLAVQYGAPPPTVEGRTVYLVDFGYPIEAMRALKAQASELIWIDHHQSQADIWRQLGWGVFDTAECGSTLTWKTLFPGQPVPPVLSYIRDKDLWLWQLPDSRAINAGLADAFGQSKVDGLLEADLTAMAARGQPILDARRERILAVVQRGTVIPDAFGIAGLRALAIPCDRDQNEVGEHVCTATSDGGLGYDVAVMFYRRGNGKWINSLRSAQAADGSVRIDCGALAAVRGGGGHPASACFLSVDPIVPAP